MAPFTSTSTGTEVARHFSTLIRDKTILITGCSVGGVGFQCALDIARQLPKLLIIANRSTARADEAALSIKKDVPGINLRSLIVDMSSMQDVRKAGLEVDTYAEDVNIIIHNAAVAGAPVSRTKEGFEVSFATNYLGPFLFTSVLLPKLLRDGHPPRIVTVGGGYMRGMTDYPWDDPQGVKQGQGGDTYSPSKAACVMFASGLARKSGGRVEAFSTSPGRVHTGLSRHLSLEQLRAGGFLNDDGTQKTEGFRSLEQGAAPYIFAAFSPEIVSGDNGGFYSSSCEADSAGLPTFITSPESQDRLWALSEHLHGEKFHSFE